MKEEMPIGVMTSVMAVLVGGAGGCLLKKYFSESLQAALNSVLGVAALAMGITLLGNTVSLSAVVLALLCGTVIGHLLKVEDRICGGIGMLCRKVRWIQTMDEEKSDAFISAMILILFSTAGIFGAINEGMSGDRTFLITKAILDLFTAAIFAADIGWLVPMLCVPQLVLQICLFLGGHTLMGILTTGMIGDFKACGGCLILAVGLKVLKVYKFRVLDFLPALLLILPISYGWQMLFG